MTSPWVALAKKKEDPSLRPARDDASSRPPPRNAPDETICVVDANAIVKGQNLTASERFRELVTTREVIGEIKDENARLRLQNDPNWSNLCVSEPSEESVQLVKRFARLTGDLGQLSEPDINVIALGIELEKVKCGGDLSHIRTTPPPPRKYRRKASKTAKPLPGWDFVSNAEDWKELDEMNAEMERMEKNLVVGEDVSERFAKIALEKEKLLQRGLEAKSLVADEDDGGEREEGAADKKDDDDDGNNENNENEWEPAISRTTRVRRMKREQRNREREEEIEKERQRIAAEMQRRAEEDGEGEEEGGEGERVDENAGVSFFQSGPGEIPEGDDDDDDGDDADDNNNADALSQYTETTQILTEEQRQHEQKRQNSRVSIVTADYAMQNVILQLGLKLYTPDGMRVKEVRRWVMRCHACETVTANTQRVFCPKCGNNALERVEKFTGPDGAEHYGVRNKHILKGTKYSIPMPKSGRMGRKMEPILREDQLIGRKITKKEREMNNIITKHTEDVFDCEFSEDKYGEYKRVGDAQKTIISIGGGNIKKNPNERKHVATNRRRK